MKKMMTMSWSSSYTKQKKCLSPDDDADKAWKIMTQKGIGHFPILHEGDLVRVITRSDIVHTLKLEILKYGENV